MSEKTENTEIESEAQEAEAAPLGEIKPASEEIANKPKSEATSDNNKAVFGTRKSRPGAAAGSNVKPLSQIRGVFDDDDEIEMDDLPVRATAPARIVANEKPRQGRERDENRDGESKRAPRRERARKPRAERENTEDTPRMSEETSPAPVSTEAANAENDEDRPERFGTVSKETLEARQSVTEFRPSQDGRRAKKPAEKRSERPAPKAKKAPAKKKGFFAWLKSLFVAEPAVEEKKPYEKRRNNRQGKGGPEGNGNRRRRRRPNNGPRRDGDRPQGENQRGDGSEGRRQGGQNRRRRRSGGNRRPRQDGQERQKTPSE